MNEYRVKSFGELHEVLDNHRRDAGWMYRGQADPEWALVPRAGRPPFDTGYDEIFFRRWKSEAMQFLDEEPENDWEWLAIAQHYGFATRLLDWAMRPLAAAYFAVAEPGVGESIIYAFKTRNHALSTSERTPFKHQGIAQFVPRRVNPRVSRQIGWFTLHGPATLSLEDGLSKDDKLERITVDASHRDELLFELNQYGVNSQSLFPNMVGLSRHFNWIMGAFDYWAEGLTGGMGTRRSESAESIGAISDDRTRQATKLIKQHGGKVKAMYALLGGHDLVLIIEAPDVPSTMKLSVELSRSTGVSFTTYPAIDVKEFDKLVAG